MQNSQGNNEKKHTTTKLIICIIIIIIIILLLITSCTSSFWGKIGNMFGNSNISIKNDTNDKLENTNKNLFFDEKEPSITLDDTAFKLTYSYKDIIPGEVVCTTSDAEIATCVAYDGYVVINPKKTGKVTIYASTTSNGIVYKATSELTITQGKNGIKMNSTSGTIVLANTDKKNVSYNLVGIKGTVKVHVADESIATATAKNGVLTIKGLKPGTTKVTLTVEYGGKTYTAEYTITVSQDKETTTKKENTTKKPSKLKLNVSFKQLYVKDKYQIKVISGKAVRWESTNKKVVTVDKKGKITAKGVGKALINAYDANGNKATVTVTVVNKPSKSKLEISTSYKVLRVGETFTPIIIKGDADRWVSSNSKIAKVDKKTGKITALKPGIVTITASDFWYFGHKVTITVEVIDDDTPINPPIDPIDPTKPTIPTNPTNPTDPTTPVRPDDLIVAETRLDMHPGDKHTLTISQGKAVSFESSDSTIATVDKYGQVIAKNPGTAVITVTGQNGEKRQVTVVVTKSVQSDDLVINETRVQMTSGDKHTIVIDRGKPVSFVSGDNNIATVDSNGVITAKNPGTTVITVTGQNGETRQVTVVVTAPTGPIEPDSNVEFLESSKTLTVGDVYTPGVKGTPVKFESSNDNIASVDPVTGKITAKNPGTVTITVTDAKGNKDTMTIIVNKVSVDNNVYLELANKMLDMTVGDTEKVLINKGTPIKYESSDNNVVTVDENGRLTAKGEGTATITVTGFYGEVRTMTVNVKKENIPENPDKELIINPTEKIMTVGDIKALNDFIKQGSYTSATSDNNKVVEIIDGKIVAKGVGTATITVNGKLNSGKITITVRPEDVILSRPSVDMIIGEKMTVDVIQGNVVKWESSDDSIAKVDPKTGEITAVGEGTVIIYAVNEAGEKTPLVVNVSKSNNTKLEKLQVWVMDQEQELKLSDDETSYRVEVESDINLNQYSILATPASGGATVEYVYPDGRVEGSLENLPLNPGDNIVKIIVTAQDGTTKDTYTVNVYKKKSTDTGVNLFAKTDAGEEKISTDSSYKVPYKKENLDVRAELEDSRSTITEIIVNGTKIELKDDFNYNIPLNPGDNTIDVKVKSQNGEEETHRYVIHRAERKIELVTTKDEFNIEDAPYTFEFKVLEDGVETDDYSLDDIIVTSDTFAGKIDKVIDPKDPKKGIISVTPLVSDIGSTHVFNVAYKDEDKDSNISLTVTKGVYSITGPTKYEEVYNPDNKVFELKFDTGILKYENDKPLYKVNKSDGKLEIVSTTDDEGKVTISYPTENVEKIELVPNTTASNSYILKVTLKAPKTEPTSFGIDIAGTIYGNATNTLNVEVNVKQKYILTLRVSDLDKDAYLNALKNTELVYPVDYDSIFDLTGIEPYKIADEENCLVFKFENWIDDNGKDFTAKEIKVDRNITLTAKFSDTSEKGEITSEGHITLKSFDLFDSDTLYGGNKLIYPGLDGAHTFTIDNDTDGILTIKNIIMEEETLCVEGNICLNMGYKVKRIIPDSTENKYYYGSDVSYKVLNKETNYGADFKTIAIPEDEFVIEKGSSAELTVLWKWLDDDANDYKIGELANTNSSYKFYIGLDFIKENETCNIKQTTTTVATTK